MLIDLVNCMFVSQSSPLPSDSIISWYCTCDFHILTLDFTLVTSISWPWILHFALPISWHWILPLWSPCIDLGLDHDGFSLRMNLIDEWHLADLYHLCGHCTLHFSLMKRDSLESLYASCGWHMFMGLLKIDSTHYSYFATWWCEFTFFLENDLAHHSDHWLDSLTVLLIRMCIQCTPLNPCNLCNLPAWCCHHSLLAYQWSHLTLDVIACEFMHLSSLYWSWMLHSPWIADWLFTCHVHFALSDFEFILWIIVILALHFDLLPMSDWQLHLHGCMTQFTSDDCVLDADLLFTHHVLDVMITLFWDISLCHCLTWCKIPLKGRGDNTLFTKTLLSLKTCCLGDPLLTPCLINVDDCTSWFHILRLHFLNFVLCDFTLLEVASHDIQGYKPLLLWACLMPWSFRVVCAQPFWWSKPSWPLPTCRLLCTLWIALID